MTHNGKLLTQIMNNLDKPRKVRTPKNQWQTPGQVTDINSRFITMQGVGFDAIGISPDGTQQYMKRGGNYVFPTGPVTEIPLLGKARMGGQLPKFQPGGEEADGGGTKSKCGITRAYAKEDIAIAKENAKEYRLADKEIAREKKELAKYHSDQYKNYINPYVDQYEEKMDRKARQQFDSDFTAFQQANPNLFVQDDTGLTPQQKYAVAMKMYSRSKYAAKVPEAVYGAPFNKRFNIDPNKVTPQQVMESINSYGWQPYLDWWQSGKQVMQEYGGEMIRRADGSYSRRGLWDNIRANRGSGKKPTKEMLEQERKIKAKEMKNGGTNNPGFQALPDYVQAKILSNMGFGGPAIPFSPEFYNQLEKEYNQFYNPKVPNRPHSDDGYDDFYSHKTAGLPKVQTSMGPGWVIRNEDVEQFVEGEKGLPMPKRVEKKKGTKTFVDDYKTMNDSPLKQQYGDMIRNIVMDRFRSKAPVEQAMGMFQDGGEPDGSMALGQIDAAIDKLQKLRKFIQPESDLEPWVSSKLTMMDHFSDAVSDYMTYNPEAKGEMAQMKNGGGIPQRYKNMGFTKVGVKKNSTRPGKKWMVLAKKGSQYKVVHGGYDGMKDFSQHGSEKRKDKFWSRMGGKNSAKAKDPFSPLYWHKKFGTWQDGGDTSQQPTAEEIVQAYSEFSGMSVEEIMGEFQGKNEQEQQELLMQMYQELMEQQEQDEMPEFEAPEEEEEEYIQEETPEEEEVAEEVEDDLEEEEAAYDVMYRKGGYIGYDGKRHVSKTPTWSGVAGYAMGGYIPEMAYGGYCYECGGAVYKNGGSTASYNVGAEMEVTPEQARELQRLGYKFDIV